ncbi:hypothetical protein, partial [Pseudonocardia sp. GCM10023141]|uniref:hypothetical protein n=1 Tax=Pseudonocardia sp. GCM10023141 TaxID=3252653 RepID=UPI00361B0B2A
GIKNQFMKKLDTLLSSQKTPAHHSPPLGGAPGLCSTSVFLAALAEATFLTYLVLFVESSSTRPNL